MRCYFAPMEGITGYLFRRAHSRAFPGVDKYYMPFLSPTQGHTFTRRELRDVLREHSEGVNAVPQLLTRRGEDFIWAARELKGMGYQEVNLNLGCPSGTVTAKGKGSGFLAFPEELDRFLEEIFSQAELAISVKTRLGVKDEEEFPALLEIFNKYPIAELTIHPRVRQDFYTGPIHSAAFRRALDKSRNPVCYNGDLCTIADINALPARYRWEPEAVMLGRGLVADPGLVTRFKGLGTPGRTEIRAFHNGLYQDYCATFGSERNAMNRMKEIWCYLIRLFEGGDRLEKALRKCTVPAEFETLSAQILRLPLRDGAPLSAGG